MALRTYTVTHTSEHGWPDDKEFIWDNDRDEVTEWLRNSGRTNKEGEPAMIAHRLDGPAIICHNGFFEWWVNGNKARDWEDFQALSRCSDEELIILKLRWGGNWER